MSVLNGDPGAACACSPGNEAGGVVENRPGLPAIAYRIGDYASFSRQMLERIQAFASQGAGPSTADPRDPAMGILDAFAVTCDVLSFYQERYANEGFLGTATERRSVLELARAIGYELAPGLSAQARLAFLVEDSALAPEVVNVRAKTPVGSVPLQGETPVTYETLEEVSARPAWNVMQASSGKPQSLKGTSWGTLQGSNLRIEPGDVLSFTWGKDDWMAATVRTVRVEPSRGQTLVAWSRLGGALAVSPQPQVSVFRLRASVFGYNAPDPRFVFSGDTDDGEDAVAKSPPRPTETLFEGASARRKVKRPARVDDEGEWTGFGLTEPHLDLDGAYPKVQAGSRLLLVDGTQVRRAEAGSVRLGALAAFAISSKSTHVTLVGGTPPLSKFSRRSTSVYLEPEELRLAEALEASPVRGHRIRIDRAVPELPAKRALIVQGLPPARVVRAEGLGFAPFGAEERRLSQGELVQVLEEPKADADGKLQFQLADATGASGVAIGEPGDIERPTELVGEIVTVLESSLGTDGRTELTLTAPLVRSYDRRSCRIYGNVALASHGETVAREVLGSGNAAEELQRFSLQKKPLARTWIEGEPQSSLSVSVNEVGWTELPSLFGADRGSEGYATSTGDDATTTLLFGLDAARLPTGTENVVASYRVGAGIAAAVAAGQLTLMKGPVLGIRGVTNPLPAEGGADPELLSEARYNAPLRVTTLDRIVSLQDFEDFVRALPGVAKASATSVWSGATQVVYVTVGLANGSPLPLGTDLERDFTLAVKGAGSFGQPFVLRGFSPALFALTALVIVDARHTPEVVLDGARQLLLTSFSFATRALSQPVTAAEVLGLLQSFEGVHGAQLLGLERIQAPGALVASRVDGVLPALPARWDAERGTLPAELLLIDPASVTLLLGTP